MRIQIEDNGLQRVNLYAGKIEVYGQVDYGPKEKPAGVTLIIDDEYGKLHVYLTMEQARNLLKIVPEPGKYIKG